MDEEQWEDLNNRFIEAACYDNKERIKQLLAAGADVNARNGMGRTSLHHSAHWGHTDIMRLLIEAGADVNVKDECGGTPLNTAVWYRHTECVRLLIQSGADMDIQNDEGQTPLHLAAYLGFMNCMKLLITSGADTDTKNNKGETPLDILKNRYPIPYKKYIDELAALALAVRKLGSEDRAQPEGIAVSGFEFDI